MKWVRDSETPTADTYFPAVTNISSRQLEKITVVAFPTLRPAAGLPQMASFLAMLHTTTLPEREGQQSGEDRLSKEDTVLLVVLGRKKEHRLLTMEQKNDVDITSVTLDMTRQMSDTEIFEGK